MTTLTPPKCPLCGGKLSRPLKDAVSDTDIRYAKATMEVTGELVCENGDYHCMTADFEAAWSKHAAALNTALAVLLTELKEANLKK